MFSKVLYSNSHIFEVMWNVCIDDHGQTESLYWLTTNPYDLVYLLLGLREPLCEFRWHTIHIFCLCLSQFL